jgi:hypothetical protein
VSEERGNVAHWDSIFEIPPMEENKGRGTLERVHRVRCFLCGREQIIRHHLIRETGVILKALGWKQKNVVGWGYDDGWTCPEHGNEE